MILLTPHCNQTNHRHNNIKRLEKATELIFCLIAAHTHLIEIGKLIALIKIKKKKKSTGTAEANTNF